MVSATYFDNSYGFFTTPQALTNEERTELAPLLRILPAENASNSPDIKH